MYNQKQHAVNLILMLEKGLTRTSCPIDDFEKDWCEKSAGTRFGKKIQNTFCKICFKFIDLKGDMEECPCDILGCDEAIKRTWFALEEKGYI